uniref:Uncharacterized protein n=1 Tax=Octopus bimaculoides TaxID=37653 RepID=A0A0L8HHB1_OCTBM
MTFSILYSLSFYTGFICKHTDLTNPPSSTILLYTFLPFPSPLPHFTYLSSSPNLLSFFLSIHIHPHNLAANFYFSDHIY